MLVVNGSQIRVEDDAFAPGERDEPFPLGPADQCQSGLEREITIGMPICTVLITISEVSRPVV